MYNIDRVYIDGQFVHPHGQEWFDLYNPSDARVIGRVRLADADDADAAIAAAHQAFPAFSRTSKEQRINGSGDCIRLSWCAWSRSPLRRRKNTAHL